MAAGVPEVGCFRTRVVFHGGGRGLNGEHRWSWKLVVCEIHRALRRRHGLSEADTVLADGAADMTRPAVQLTTAGRRGVGIAPVLILARRALGEQGCEQQRQQRQRANGERETMCANPRVRALRGKARGSSLKFRRVGCRRPSGLPDSIWCCQFHTHQTGKARKE